MKLINTVDAVGHVLCHDITQIIKDVCKGARYRKGHVVQEEDIPVLLSLGKETLYVWEKQPGMLHEDEAAPILYRLCADENMYGGDIKEGKIEVFADKDGFFQADIQKLRSVNSLGDMMIATRRSNCPVKKGSKLAGTRVIPLIISEEKLRQAESQGKGAPILKLYPYIHKRYGIVTIGNEVAKGRIKDTFTPVIREKLSEFPGDEVAHVTLADDHRAVTEAILKIIDDGAEMVICTGGMSVDPDDKTPLAIKNTGAHVVSYGAPVLPGAMFMLAYYHGIPIMGLPGCVMYARRTIFDLVLPRIMAGINVSQDDLAALGNGGLCMECDECIFPNCGFGAGI